MPGEGRIGKKGIAPYGVAAAAAAIFALDQAAKFAVKGFISPGESVPVIKGIFHITLVMNKGAAFGIFKDQGALFVIVGIAVAAFIIYSLPRLLREGALIRAATALMLGGAAGNLIDRLRFGYVVDFLDFRVWPVFNVADSAITVGTILICIRLLTQNVERKAQN